MKKLKIKQTTWNLKPLFKGDNDPEMEKQRIIVEKESYKFINKWKDRDDYLKDPKILKQALDEYENWQRDCGAFGNEGIYFFLRTCQDKNNFKLKAKLNKNQDTGIKIINDIQFFAMKVARLPRKEQKSFLENEGLKDYKHFLEKLFAEAEYLLSGPEEKILNLKSGPAYTNWVNMTEEFLSCEEREVLDDDGKKKIKSFSEIFSLTSDKRKKVRDAAAKAINDIFAKNLDVAEREMNSIMADKKINDELRGFSRPDGAMHLSDDIDDRVADTLVGAAADRFSVSKKYYRLKAKLFGFEKLKYYERNVEYGKIDKKYSYQEAVDLVYKVFTETDQDFADIFQGFVDNSQIDIYPRKGKNGGGFCAHDLMSQPSFILLNHTGRLKDVFDLAHEAGHGINNSLMKKEQNALNFNAPPFFGEVASKLAEEFLFAEILNEKDEELRLAAMMMKLNDEIVHIFRTTAENRFEREMHQKFRAQGYLSKKEIGQLYKKYVAEYLGNYIEQPPGSENWWVYIHHLRVFFYNYQYASGILIAKALYSFNKEDPEFINKIKGILSAGSSESPKNIFNKIGIDITDKKFWDKGISETENLLKETEKLAKKLGKI